MKDPSFIYYTPPCLIKLLFKSEVPHLNICATWGWKGARSLRARAQTHTHTHTHRHTHWILVARQKHPSSHLQWHQVRLCARHLYCTDIWLRKSDVFWRTCAPPLCSAKPAGCLGGLAAVKQWRGGEGALLLSEGLRQTVTHQPKDCLLLTACAQRVTITNRAASDRSASLLRL